MYPCHRGSKLSVYYKVLEYIPRGLREKPKVGQKRTRDSPENWHTVGTRKGGGEKKWANEKIIHLAILSPSFYCSPGEEEEDVEIKFLWHRFKNQAFSLPPSFFQPRLATRRKTRRRLEVFSSSIFWETPLREKTVCVHTHLWLVRRLV